MTKPPENVPCQVPGNAPGNAPSPSAHELHDDALLIRRVLSGDRAAFGQIVEKYHRQAYHSAYAVLGNSSDAEEIAQETFVQVYQKLDRLREPGALPGWVWRISRDTALKHIRKHRRVRPVGELPEVVNDAGAPHLRLVAGEEKEALLGALEQLPDEMREALLMRYWEDIDYEEMAARTGISAGTLYQRVCRGLKKLRELLDAAQRSDHKDRA